MTESELSPTFYSYTPILGVRWWGLETVSDSLYVRGVFGTIWTTPFLDAMCIRSRHSSPDLNCTCGIYAHKPDKNSATAAETRALGVQGGLVGLTALEDVIEHQLGYRAARALLFAALTDQYYLERLCAKWPTVYFTTSPDHFQALVSHYEAHPEEIPQPRSTHGDRKTNPAHQARNRANIPFPGEDEEAWRSRTGYYSTLFPGYAPYYPYYDAKAKGAGSGLT